MANRRRGRDRRDRRDVRKNRERGRQPFRGDPSQAVGTVGAGRVRQHDLRGPFFRRQRLKKRLPLGERLVDRQDDPVEQRIVQLIRVSHERLRLLHDLRNGRRIEPSQIADRLERDGSRRGDGPRSPFLDLTAIQEGVQIGVEQLEGKG